jgi:hypothetical protein
MSILTQQGANRTMNEVELLANQGRREHSQATNPRKKKRHVAGLFDSGSICNA